MVDNFEVIKDYISRCDAEYELPLDQDEDSFYLVQMLKRCKDNPRLKSDFHCVSRFIINKIDDLDRYRDEITKMSEVFNARAYIDVDRKTGKQTTTLSLYELAQKVANHDYKTTSNAVYSPTGNSENNSHQKWVVDVDAEDSDDVSRLAELYKEHINNHCSQNDNNNTVITTVKTKTGIHLITHPFKRKLFMEYVKSLGVEKSLHDVVKISASTILYIA